MQGLRSTDQLTFNNLDRSKLSWFNHKTKINNKNDVYILEMQPKEGEMQRVSKNAT
jgi:hypothetical protein